MRTSRNQPRYTPKQSLILGLIAVIFGLVLIVLPKGGVPELNSLEEVSGTVKSLRMTKSGKYSEAIRFELDSGPHSFVYSSSSGASDKVLDALRESPPRLVTILYYPGDSHSPPFDHRSYYDVFSLRLGSSTVRSFDEISVGLNNNNLLGIWLGVAFIILGGAMIAAAKRMRSAA